MAVWPCSFSLRLSSAASSRMNCRAGARERNTVIVVRGSGNLKASTIYEESDRQLARNQEEETPKASLNNRLCIRAQWGRPRSESKETSLSLFVFNGGGVDDDDDDDDTVSPIKTLIEDRRITPRVRCKFRIVFSLCFARNDRRTVMEVAPHHYFFDIY